MSGGRIAAGGFRIERNTYLDIVWLDRRVTIGKNKVSDGVSTLVKTNMGRITLAPDCFLSVLSMLGK